RGVRRGLEHRHTVLADAQAADRVAVEVERGELLARPSAKLGIEAALRDREAKLSRRARQVTLTLRPEGRAAHRLLQLRTGHARRRADVEAHCDVGAELLLDPGGELRREALGAAIVDRAEGDAVVVGAEQR